MQKERAIWRNCLEWKRENDKDKEGSLRSTNVVVVDANSDGDLCSVSSNLTIWLILGFWIKHIRYMWLLIGTSLTLIG